MYPIRAPQWTETDIQRLLAPISDVSPCGESLRYEGTYDQILDARKEDDPVLARGVWKLPLKRADWQMVERLSLDALTNRTKDLQIAVWLLESWTHLYSFTGLREGLRVLAFLCDTFWDGLYPGAENGDLEYRLAPLITLNEKLPVTIKLLPITYPESDDVKPYCWADWDNATRTQSAPQPAKTAPEPPSQAAFQQSALLTPTDFFSGLLEDVERSMEACSELESILQNHCGDDAPSLRQLWTAMESIRGLMTSFLSQRIPEGGLEPVTEITTGMRGSETEPGTEQDDPGVATGSSGPIRSRADAYRRLSEAADYLARTEPHSPTPYLVRRAIAWGGMRLEELLPELVHSASDLAEVYKLLQIAKK